MRTALLIVMTMLGYLLVWPVPITPVAWTPPPAPSLEEGTFAANDKLRGVQRLADGIGQGPEAIAFDSAGRVYSGLHDGRVFSMEADGSDCRALANTGGRPLGMHVTADGDVIVADAIKGLLSLAPGGEIKVLATTAEGIRLHFTDDLDVDERGRVYFSDASWKFGYGEHLLDALEHGARGRLLRYEPELGEAVTFMVNRHFANGVALGPDESYVLLSETTEYKITRMWLRGDKASQIETFAENLPGFPDNLTFNGRDRFWVALYAPRDSMLDAILPYPLLREIVARLPAFLQPAPPRHSFIVGLDLDGHVAEQYQFSGDGAFAPVTSVREHQGWLYLGSLSERGIGRIRLQDLRRGGPGSVPPAPVAATCRAAPQRENEAENRAK